MAHYIHIVIPPVGRRALKTPKATEDIPFLLTDPHDRENNKNGLVTCLY